MSFLNKKPVTKDQDADDGNDHNLLILGVVCTIIAIITSGISLYIYHASGDIYLDRSRPGFLPDEEEQSETPRSNYKFSDTGSLDESVLQEYLDNFDDALDAFDALEDPFSVSPLSDESLGFTDNPTDNSTENSQNLDE